MAEGQIAVETDSVVRDLTAFQQNILVILAEEPMYGLAIKSHLETYYGTEVNHGRLYPNLDDLVEMGLVEKSELDKRTNQYELTDDGHTALLDQFDWMFSKFVADDERAGELEDLIDASQ
jgi:DNA-binding PadR family transcriptional regulator